MVDESLHTGAGGDMHETPAHKSAGFPHLPGVDLSVVGQVPPHPLLCPQRSPVQDGVHDCVSAGLPCTVPQSLLSVQVLVFCPEELHADQSVHCQLDVHSGS